MQNPLPNAVVRAASQFGEEGRRWLAGLPAVVHGLAELWGIVLESPLPKAGCAFVARARRRDGSRVVLKVPIPHREAQHEAAALRAWDGRGAIRLLSLDAHTGAMLLEACEPGTHLSGAGEVSAAGAYLLRRLHIPTPKAHPFERLRDVCAEWADLARKRVRRLGSRDDAGLVDAGAELLEALPLDAGESVLLHGDYHHWNVLAATRERWLAIDPKPMVGDPVFDAAQFLGNRYAAVRDEAVFRTEIDAFAAASGFERTRILLWCFAREIENAMWALSIGDVEQSRDTIEYARLLRKLLDEQGGIG